MVLLAAVRVLRRARLGSVRFLACLLARAAGLRGVRAAARAKDVPRSVCSFLFALLSAVSFPNPFLFFVRFAVQIKDSQARKWQGKLVLVLLPRWEGCPC